MIRSSRFNIYLLVLVVGVFCVGCHSTGRKKNKELTALRIHVEARKDLAGRTTEVSVLRGDPIKLNVDRSPALTEVQIKDAKVVEVMGGFAIWLQFDRRGAWVLEQLTTGNKGKRLAIFVGFVGVGEGKERSKEARWLAAPLIMNRITDGVLSFTPDCTLEEADLIVEGLCNAAKEYGSPEPKW